MKQFVPWLYLSLLAPITLSSLIAGPYQSVFLWYAYRLDIKASEPGPPRIAPNCIGTAPGRTCYFDEFLKYIQRKGPHIDPWTGRSSVGTNLNPDVFRTADELANGGIKGTPSRYQDVIEPTKLLPSVFTDKILASPRYGQLFGPVVDIVQACRQHFKDVNIDSELEGLKRSVVSMLEGRVQEQSQKVIDTVNKELKNRKFTWRVITMNNQRPDGSPWKEINTEATLKAHPEANTALNEIIQKYVTGFDSLSRTNEGHSAAIEAAKDFQSKILSRLPC